MKILPWLILIGMCFPWGWLLSYLGVVGAMAGFIYQGLAWIGVVCLMAFSKCNKVI